MISNMKWPLLAILFIGLGFFACTFLDLKNSESYKLKISAQGIELESKQKSIDGLAGVVQRLNRPERANH